MMPFQSRDCGPTKLASPTLAGCRVESWMMERAKMNSPNADMNVRIAHTRMPFRASGRTIRQNAPNRVLPSTRPASSSSLGTAMKLARTSTTKNGTALAVAASTTAVRGISSNPT